MDVNRRGFLGLAGAAGMLPVLGADAPRIARIGMMTDTHVGTTMESCRWVRAALALFKLKGAEMVINCGDLADQHYIEGYRCYRRTVDEVYPDAASRPKEVYVYASHDVYNYRPGAGWNSNNAAAAYEEMRSLLQDPNGHTCTFTWRGLPFAVFPQEVGHKDFIGWDDCEKTVAKLCAENPGKPVFVCAHVPPQGTTFHSWHWGNGNLRRILDKFPQVISISGHVHGSLVSERQIWQGEFTALNLGCLQTWGGYAVGSTPPPQAKPNFGVLVMDVYRDRLVVFRYDVRDGSECGAPWVVPLPFASKVAPYAPTTGYAIEFPEASGGERAFHCRIACARRDAAGVWKTYSCDDVFGDFWKAAKDRSGRARYVLSAGFFKPGTCHRVVVTPMDCFYQAGKPISCDFTATHAARTLWRCADLAALTFTEYGKNVPRGADGFFVPSSGQGTLHLPKYVFANLEKGVRHRFVVDVHTRQPHGCYCSWYMSLGASDNWHRQFGKALTAPGDPGVLRYVFDFTPGADFPASCDLAFTPASPGASLRAVGLSLER